MLVKANLKILNKYDLFTLTVEATDIPSFSVGGNWLNLSVVQEDSLKSLKDEKPLS